MAINQEKLQRVCDILHERYHSPRLGNKRNPLNELVFIILTTKTGPKNYTRTYNALRKKYPSWNEVLIADPDEVAQVISPGGLANQKARLLQKVLGAIRETSGKRLSLSFLKSYSDQEAETYLLSLPGVGYKIAKCVLMYALDRQVLPVDTHTYRLALELGLINETYMRNEKGKLHKELEELIPPHLRYGFHVNSVVHGRKEHRTRSDTKCPLVRLLEAEALTPLH